MCIQELPTNRFPQAMNAGLSFLCAVYAYKLYVMCGKSEVSSFKAGDVTVTAPADEGDKAEKLWQDQLAKCSDLIKKEGFLFGRVVT